jgi:hypothetical protein
VRAGARARQDQGTQHGVRSLNLQLACMYNGRFIMYDDVERCGYQKCHPKNKKQKITEGKLCVPLKPNYFMKQRFSCNVTDVIQRASSMS